MTEQGTVYHAAQAAGVSRQTVYRWREEDPQFADLWYEAIENAVDRVENTICRRALDGDTIAAIFYLKAQRPTEQHQAAAMKRMQQHKAAM